VGRIDAMISMQESTLRLPGIFSEVITAMMRELKQRIVRRGKGGWIYNMVVIGGRRVRRT
jgi:hypothetical protein